VHRLGIGLAVVGSLIGLSALAGGFAYALIAL
jgi:hypothetical protein